MRDSEIEKILAIRSSDLINAIPKESLKSYLNVGGDEFKKRISKIQTSGCAYALELSNIDKIKESRKRKQNFDESPIHKKVVKLNESSFKQNFYGYNSTPKETVKFNEDPFKQTDFPDSPFFLFSSDDDNKNEFSFLGEIDEPVGYN